MRVCNWSRSVTIRARSRHVCFLAKRTNSPNIGNIFPEKFEFTERDAVSEFVYALPKRINDQSSRDGYTSPRRRGATLLSLYHTGVTFFSVLFIFTYINTICTRRRVHISEKTLSFLNGEFEVEPGYGERREEALKMASIKTFFIIKTIKPVSDTRVNSRDVRFGIFARW